MPPSRPPPPPIGPPLSPPLGIPPLPKTGALVAALVALPFAGALALALLTLVLKVALVPAQFSRLQWLLVENLLLSLQKIRAMGR